MADILVIGSLNMDMTLYVDRFPQIGETLPCTGMLTAPGGKGSNQALAASRLGGIVKMAGCVGCDAYGNELIDSLQANGVDTSLIKRMPDVSTGVAAITVSNGANMILVSAGANAAITPEYIDLLDDEIAVARAVVLQLEIPMPAVLQAARLAHKHGCLVLLNPAPYQPMPEELLRLVDYLIPNETEAMAMLGVDHLDASNAEASLRAMQSFGVAHPMITMGDKGVAYLNGDAYHLDPCNKVQAVDPTAAGDTFIGGFISALLGGSSIGEAVAFAQKASAFCVAHKGAQTSIPTVAQLAQQQA